MTSEQIAGLMEKQRTYSKSGVTIPVEFRIVQLKKLYAAVKKYEAEINDAPRLYGNVLSGAVPAGIIHVSQDNDTRRLIR